jgi:hypothetical protein
MQLIVQKKGYRLLPILALAVAMAVLVFIARDTQAVHAEAILELDTAAGPIIVPGPTDDCTTSLSAPPVLCSAADLDNDGGGAPLDWESLCEAGAGGLITPKAFGAPIDQRSCLSDFQRPDHTYFDSEKDIYDIVDVASGGITTQFWECVEQSTVLPKNEILNGYAALATVPAGTNAGDRVLYVGGERDSNNGTSFIGAWFLQADASCSHTGNGNTAFTSTSAHQVGDLLLIADFPSGGKIGEIKLFEWCPATEAGCSPGASDPLQEIASGLDCSDLPAAALDDVCGVVNSVNVVTPVWKNECVAVGSNKCASTITTPEETNTVFEIGVNLTNSGFPGALPCFSTFVLETRSSVQFDATTKDFVAGSFPTCGKLTIEKETDPDGAAGTFSYTNDAGADCDPSFDLEDDGSQVCDDLTPAVYLVTEDDPTALTPPFDLVNIVCTVDVGSGSGTSYRIGKIDGGGVFDPGSTDEFDAGEDEDTVEITIGTLGEVTCTYTNRQRGSILVRKETESGALLPGACFTFDPDPADGTGAAVEICDGDAADQAVGDDGLVCIDGVVFLGDDTVADSGYDITETVVPDGFEGDPDTENVVVDSTSNCADRLAATTPVPDATFVNKLGSILINKVVDKAGNPLLGGACFTIAPDGTTGTGTFTGTVCDNNVDNIPGLGAPDLTDNDATAGEICVDDVPLDDYDITESIVPANFLGDTPKDVTVSNSDDCAALTAIVFKNVPLSKFQIKFFDLTGFTDAAIDCSNATEVSENGGADTLTITGNTAANPTVVTTSAAHDLVTGAKVQITGSNSSPLINGTFTVTFVSPTAFSIPVNLSGGTAGTNPAGTVVAFDDTDETFGNGTTTLVPGLYSCTINVDP